ncbi:response regulator transcription factor [Brevibacillus laterosporus]|uniref:response regulator transcription factor n=1 Tax=Brevibacillus laterosporus TaxID=1465 RepID=UPI001443CE56|nr:response regulator transcription factor [Brevibacillus laterosporus]NKQ21886.1 response regulator transcription factor [Brevibacillus laterosporus]WNX32045.1 response regulator transcription factor [Brevibacillus laterosporus]
MQTIVIVEDEGPISRVLQVYLEKAGYQVELAFDGEEAVHTFDRVEPSLVLLDVMLPGQSGWKVLEYIRTKSSCPVIMLTALGQLDQKINGLNQGADDYITKPFIGEEVVARVNAVMRRSLLVMGDYQTRIFGSLKVDYRAHSVTLHGIELTFTPRDLSVFLFLAQHPNQTFTREQLIEQVWGMDYEGSDRAVDLAVKRIRRTLQNWPTDEGEIRTLRGLGYQFCVNEK